MLKSIAGITIRPGVMLIVAVEQDTEGTYSVRAVLPMLRGSTVLPLAQNTYECALDTARALIAKYRTA